MPYKDLEKNLAYQKEWYLKNKERIAKKYWDKKKEMAFQKGLTELRLERSGMRPK